jgi:hypothetical protein
MFPSMLAFPWELCKLALGSSVASAGTTILGICGTIAYPIADLIRELWRNGLFGMGQHWRERLKFSFIIGVVWWSLLFCYQLFYAVPHKIRTQAMHISAPRTTHPPVPPQLAFIRTRSRIIASPVNEETKLLSETRDLADIIENIWKDYDVRARAFRATYDQNIAQGANATAAQPIYRIHLADLDAYEDKKYQQHKARILQLREKLLDQFPGMSPQPGNAGLLEGTKNLYEHPQGDIYKIVAQDFRSLADAYQKKFKIKPPHPEP